MKFRSLLFCIAASMPTYSSAAYLPVAHSIAYEDVPSRQGPRILAHYLGPFGVFFTLGCLYGVYLNAMINQPSSITNLKRLRTAALIVALTIIVLSCTSTTDDAAMISSSIAGFIAGGGLGYTWQGIISFLQSRRNQRNRGGAL